MPGQFNRRQLLASVPIATLGVATTGHQAHAAPAAARQAALAEDQTLRLVAGEISPFIRPSNEGGPVRMMTQNTFMPPFYPDEAGNLLPGVCTEWAVSEDGLVYTLTMDPRATFSDGSQVTAADLKFSWEYLGYPETASGSAPNLLAPIAGSADVLSGDTTDMAGLVVIDDATLQVTLSQLFTPFPLAFSSYFAGVIKRDNALSGDDWDLNPVCCGPYKLESWNKGAGELTWVINEHWWGPTPTITNVHFRSILDYNTQSIMYDNNEMDILEASEFLATQSGSVDPAQLYPVPLSGLYFFVFETTRAPMDDVNVRRALLKASDMATIVQAVYQGGSAPAYGVTPPNLASFADLGPYYDPEGAVQALAASTYGSAADLPPISVRVPADNPEFIRVAEALQQMWQDLLGVELSISPIATDEERDDGTSQMFRLSAGTTYADPGITVTNLGLSTNTYMRNFVKAPNEELDEILIEGNSLPIEQEAERVALFQEAEQLIMDEAYYIPITWLRFYYTVKPWVNGLRANSSLSIYTLPEMAISEH